VLTAEKPMTETQPGNNLSWRVTVLERQVERLQEGKPDVVAERVSRMASDVSDLRRELHDDVQALRDELATQRRILIGFFVSFALLAVGIALSYILSGHPVA
jgi:hypothetical protein